MSDFEQLNKKVDSLEGKVDKLEGKVDNLEGKVDNIDEKFERRFSNLERLVIELKESLERQIGDHIREMRESTAAIKSRCDVQQLRLDRHAGLWQAGTRWSSRMDVWAEKVDSELEAKDRAISELKERVRKLEDREER